MSEKQTPPAKGDKQKPGTEYTGAKKHFERYKADVVIPRDNEGDVIRDKKGRVEFKAVKGVKLGDAYITEDHAAAFNAGRLEGGNSSVELIYEPGAETPYGY